MSVEYLDCTVCGRKEYPMGSMSYVVRKNICKGCIAWFLHYRKAFSVEDYSAGLDKLYIARHGVVSCANEFI